MNNRKNHLLMSLADNLSTADMKFGDKKKVNERHQELLDKKPDLVSIDYMNLLPNPPANNSPQVRQELTKIKKSMEKLEKNKELKSLVLKVDIDADWTLKQVAERYGIEYPQKLLDKLWRDVISPIQMQLKWKFNRPRPYQLGKKLGIDIKHIETKTHNSPSYPSGHAIHGYFSAFVLEDMFPEQRQEWMNAAREVARARVAQGVHYPSDGDAAFYVAKKIWNNVKDKYKTILT